MTKKNNRINVTLGRKISNDLQYVPSRICIQSVMKFKFRNAFASPLDSIFSLLPSNQLKSYVKSWLPVACTQIEPTLPITGLTYSWNKGLCIITSCWSLAFAPQFSSWSKQYNLPNIDNKNTWTASNAIKWGTPLAPPSLQRCSSKSSVKSSVENRWVDRWWYFIRVWVGE